jgi:hypothetical protein
MGRLGGRGMHDPDRPSAAGAAVERAERYSPRVWSRLIFNQIHLDN